MTPPCPTPEKRGYRTKRYAKQQLRKIQSGQRAAPAGSDHLYRCICGSWHHTKYRKQNYQNREKYRNRV